MILRIAVTLALLATAPAIAADVKASQACAATLSPEGKAMYSASAASVKPDSVIGDVIRASVIPMVMGGSMSADTARANGPAVGKCLAMLK